MFLRGNLKSWRNTILGALVVLSGVSAAVITVVARRSGDWELTRLGAIASLLFAVLIVIFVVPPLARSARAEAARLDLGFQVTAGGGVFVGIYAVVAFAAWNTGNNLLFLVFSVMTSTLFVASSAARAALREGRAENRADVRAARARARHGLRDFDALPARPLPPAASSARARRGDCRLPEAGARGRRAAPAAG